MSPIPYSLSNDLITVTVGGVPKYVRKGTAEFADLRTALVNEDWDAASALLKPGGGVAKYLADHGLTDFVTADGQLTYKGEPVQGDIRARIERMAAAGEDPTPVLRFYERLQQNPSKRSVDQLFAFLQHCHLPFEADGHFLAYKGVNDDLTDKYTGRIHNTPGAVIQMNRNLVSDDPRTPCHEGLHVGALEYASSFAAHTIACRIDPKNVVCVPYDSSHQKMRVCEYEVVGHYSGEPMPSTTIPSEDVPTSDVDVTGKTAPCANCGITTDAKEMFCFGCKNVVCDDCDQDYDRAMGPHDLSAHLTGDSPDADSRKGEVDERARGIAEETRAAKVDAMLDAEIAELEQGAAERAKTQAAKFRKFKGMTTRQLTEQTLADLRDYALKLKIVGAGHVRGGKTALVPKIVRARQLANRKRPKSTHGKRH